MLESAFTKTTITPQPAQGHELAGYITRREKSRGVHDDIELRALLIEDESAVLLVNLDLLGVDTHIKETIQRVAEKTIGNVNVIVTATHTHSAPATLFTNLLLTFGDNVFRKDYFDYFVEQTEKTFSNIANNLEPTETYIYKTKIRDIATDRNDPRNPIDNEALLLIFASKGEAKGFLVNYAVHPTVLGPDNLLITKDLIEYILKGLYSVLKTNIGLFLNGAAGNISTRFTRRAQTFSEAERIGNEFARQVLASKFRLHNVENLRIVSKEITVSFKEYTEEEIRKLSMPTWKNGTRRSESLREGIEALNKLYPIISKKRYTAKTEIIGLNLGDLKMIFVPFELHSDISLSLKKLVEPQYLALVGYTNEYFGYLLMKEAEPGYENIMQFVDEKTRQQVFSAICNVLDIDPCSL